MPTTQQSAQYNEAPINTNLDYGSVEVCEKILIEFSLGKPAELGDTSKKSWLNGKSVGAQGYCRPLQHKGHSLKLKAKTNLFTQLRNFRLGLTSNERIASSIGEDNDDHEQRSSKMCMGLCVCGHDMHAGEMCVLCI